MWFRRLRSLSDVRNEQKLNKLSQITQQSVKSSEDVLDEIRQTQHELRISTYEDNFSNSGHTSPTPSFRERQPKQKSMFPLGKSLLYKKKTAVPTVKLIVI